jgi:hypothetical protein
MPLCFLHFDTFKTFLQLKLTLLNFNYKTIHTFLHVPPVVRLPPFANHWTGTTAHVE